MKQHAWIISTALLVWTAVFLPPDAAAQQPFAWQQTGGPFGGNMSVLAADPYTGKLWTYVAHHGLYVSDDSGDTWLSTGPSVTSARAFAFRHDGTLFTDRHRSDDQGALWIKTGFPDSTFVRALAVDSTTGNVIAGASGGLYVSDDDAETWTYSHAANVQRLVVTGQGFVFALKKYDRSAFLRSADGGLTWERVDFPRQRLPLGMVMGPDGDLYVSTIDDDQQQAVRLYASSDQGETWERRTNLSRRCLAEDLLGFDPTGRLFMANSESVFRLSADLDGCTTIFDDHERTNEASGTSRSGILRTAFIDTRGQVFAVSRFGGPFRSRDGGETWAFLSKTGIVASNIWSLLVEQETGVVWAGTSRDGLFRSDDQGQTWNRRGFETQSIIDLTASATPGELWAATVYEGLYYSSDGGATWAYTPNDAVQGTLFDLHYAPASHTLFAHYPVFDIYFTEDRGQTWHAMNVPINNRLDPPLLAMTVSADEDVYAAVLEPLEKTFVIHHTRDRGQTWEPLSADFPGMDTRDPYYGVHLLMDAADTLWAAIRNTMYFTADAGATWNRAVDVPGLIYKLFESPDGALWIGHEEGVHRSTDRGRTWHALGTGLTHPFVITLTWDPHTETILAGTHTGGVFRGRAEGQATSVVEEAAPPGTARAVNLSNYPNPFACTTTIAFDLPRAGPVRLVLYDVLGREVARLLDRTLPQGPHRLLVDGARLSPGVYVYRLDTPSGVFTRQMTYVR